MVRETFTKKVLTLVKCPHHNVPPHHHTIQPPAGPQLSASHLSYLQVWARQITGLTALISHFSQLHHAETRRLYHSDVGCSEWDSHLADGINGIVAEATGYKMAIFSAEDGVFGHQADMTTSLTNLSTHLVNSSQQTKSSTWLLALPPTFPR